MVENDFRSKLTLVEIYRRHLVMASPIFHNIERYIMLALTGVRNEYLHIIESSLKPLVTL